MNRETKQIRCNWPSAMAMHFADRYNDGEYAFHQGVSWQVVGAKVIGNVYIDFTLKRVINHQA